MKPTYKVYARCNGGHGTYLQQEFEGSRYQCEKYLKDKVHQRRPTHFNLISTLPIEVARRRYVDY